MELMEEGEFGDEKHFKTLVDSVNAMEGGNDWFSLANNFVVDLDAQEEVDRVWHDQDEWTRRSILYIINSGKFPSNRICKGYLGRGGTLFVIGKNRDASKEMANSWKWMTSWHIYGRMCICLSMAVCFHFFMILHFLMEYQLKRN